MVLTLCIDKQPKNNPSSELKTCQIDIGDRLCSKDGVYDELIIKLNEVNQLDGIIKRRCSIDRLDVITILPEEHIQTLEIPEITLFEGTNYVYLQEFDYLNMKIEYLTNVEMNKHYAKTEEFHSALVLTAQEFNLKLSKKLDGEEFTHASIVAKINDDTSEVQIEADKINMKGKEFNLTADNMTIKSENFSVDEDGKISATAGEIGGFSLDDKELYTEYAPEEQIFTIEDYKKVQKYIIGTGTLTPEEFEKYDVNHDGIINSLDLLKIYKNIYYSKGANFRIDSSDFDNFISMEYNNEKTVQIGPKSATLPSLSIKDGGLTIQKTNALPLISIQNDSSAYINMQTDDYQYCDFTAWGNNSVKIQTNFKTGAVKCVSLTQTSEEKYKKDFEKLNNALDIIKNIDIYKYHMKEENDTDKKHIGFVIGDKFNYSKEVTSKENDSVELYSYISVCCKAIQEQQEQIKQLQERIERLESGKKWHITELIGKIVRALTHQ